jgi:hypothetical protein
MLFTPGGLLGRHAVPLYSSAIWAFSSAALLLPLYLSVTLLKRFQKSIIPK